MKIKIQQFLYQNHSWAVVGWNLAQALSNNNILHLVPTDANKKCHLPENLNKYVLNMPDKNYDCQISYTAPINWCHYLLQGNKNRFAIWAYEFNGKNTLPSGFAKYYKFVNKILAPSTFCKDVFVNSNVPAEKIVVVPHGINLETYKNKNKITLHTKKTIKIGLPLGQLHARKNLDGLLQAYLSAFTKNDDVCLVLKTQTQKQQQKEINHAFDIDFYKLYNFYRSKFKSGGEIELVTDFIDDMTTFYNACDIIFTMSNCEGFYMPGLEGMAAEKLIIAPRYGGQLDFLNDSNSLLIDGKIVRAPRSYQYWNQSPYAEMFEPSIDDAISKLRLAVDSYELLLNKFMPNMQEQVNKLTWTNIGNQIVGLCE